MSHTEHPETNPYAAPQSKVGVSDFGQPATFYGYAGFWRRFAAYLIDSIILGIAGGVIGFVIGIVAAATGNAEGGQVSPGLTIGVQLVTFIMQVLYFAGMESSSSQATLGKMALGVKVVDLQGRRISFGRALGRFFGKILSSIILLIGFIMAAFTEKKQALHDMLAGTLVIKTRCAGRRTISTPGGPGHPTRAAASDCC
jgi:uncharacterized RDD family membrane protein YckC